MMSFKYLVLVLFSRHERNAVNTRLQSSNSRQLLLELIAGYEPKTLVTDQVSTISRSFCTTSNMGNRA
jgi:hypothetical protein